MISFYCYFVIYFILFLFLWVHLDSWHSTLNNVSAWISDEWCFITSCSDLYVGNSRLWVTCTLTTYNMIVSTLKQLWKWWNILYLTHWLDQSDSSHCFIIPNSWSLLWLIRSTHFTEFNLIWLISIIFFNAEKVFDSDLIIESAELSSSLIHLISVISRRS